METWLRIYTYVYARRKIEWGAQATLTRDSKLRGAAATAERISIVCRCEMRAVSFRELTSARFNSVRACASAWKCGGRYTCWIYMWICMYTSYIAAHTMERASRIHRIDLLSGGNESTGRCIICRATHAQSCGSIIECAYMRARVRAHAQLRTYVYVGDGEKGGEEGKRQGF